MRKRLKALAFRLLTNPFRVKKALKRMVQTQRISILNFHRVGPADGSAYRPLPTDLFEDIIAFCVTEGEVRHFANLGLPAAKKPIFVISFDDGYLDFAEHALPVLRRYGVRCNHNFIPACADELRPPLNVYVQDFIGKAPAELVEELCRQLGHEADLSRGREDLGNSVSAAFKGRPIEQQKRLVAKLRPTLERFDQFESTPMMSVADIKSVSSEVEVGCHSYEHATLGKETDDYVCTDAVKCIDWFRDRLAITTPIYALPNGSGTDQQVQLLQELGFSTILKVGEQMSDRHASAHTRFTIYGETVSEIRGRSLGLTPS